MTNPNDEELNRLARALGEALAARQMTVALAESCTGGWVAKTLTDVPGSSEWFRYGVVSYANQAKVRLLGVSQVVINRYGAVSRPTVRAMAAGVQRISGAHQAIAVSGVAGPGGGTDDKPVGTVWFAFSAPMETVEEELRFAGDRETVRRMSVAHALKAARQQLERT